MTNKSKLTLVIAVAASAIASPAFARSFDPDIGSGNNTTFAYEPAIQQGTIAVHHDGREHRIGRRSGLNAFAMVADDRSGINSNDPAVTGGGATSATLAQDGQCFGDRPYYDFYGAGWLDSELHLGIDCNIAPPGSVHPRERGWARRLKVRLGERRVENQLVEHNGIAAHANATGIVEAKSFWRSLRHTEFAARHQSAGDAVDDSSTGT
jgi:hypothetical protein